MNGVFRQGFKELLIDDFVVLRKSYTTDEIGGEKVNFVLIDSGKGRLSITGRGSERIRGGKDTSEVDYILFTLPERNIIKNDRIELSELQLRVISVQNPSNLNHHLEVLLEEIQPRFDVRLFGVIDERDRVIGTIVEITLEGNIQEREQIIAQLGRKLGLKANVIETDEVTAELTSLIGLKSLVNELEATTANITLDIGLKTLVSDLEAVDGLLGLDRDILAEVNELEDIKSLLGRNRPVVGSIDEAEQITGELLITRVISLIGQINELEQLDGSLSVNISLASAIEELEELTGLIGLDRQVQGLIEEQEQIASQLASKRGISTEVNEQELVDGVLTLLVGLISTINELEDVTGNIVLDRLIAGQINQLEDTQGNISVEFSIAGNIEEQEIIISQLSATKQLSGAITDSENLTGDLRIDVFLVLLEGVINESEIITGAITKDNGLIAEVNETEQITGNIVLNISLQASSDEIEDVTGNITLDINLSGLVEELETTQASLSMLIILLGQINETETLAGQIGILKSLQATASEIDNLESNLAVARLISGVIDEQELIDVDLVRFRGLKSLITETEQVDGQIALLSNIAGQIEEIEDIETLLSVLKTINGQIEDLELLEASLSRGLPLSGQLLELENLIGDLTVIEAVVDRLIAVSSGGDDRQLKLLRFDGASITQEDVQDVGNTGFGNDSWTQGGVEYISVAHSVVDDNHLTLFSWNGINLELLDRLNIGGTSYDVHTWEETATGDRLIGVVHENSPFFSLIRWNGTTLAFEDGFNVNFTPFGVHSWEEATTGDRLIAVGVFTDPQLQVLRWDGTSLTQVASAIVQDSFNGGTDCFTAEYDGERWICLTTNSQDAENPFTVWLFSFDGTNLISRDTLHLSDVITDTNFMFVENNELYILIGNDGGINDEAVLVKWDDVQEELTIENQLILAGRVRGSNGWEQGGDYYFPLGYQTTPFFSVVNWDGVSLTELDNYELEGTGFDTKAFEIIQPDADEYTSFIEYNLNQEPNDWTEIWRPTGVTTELVELNDAREGVAVNRSITSSVPRLWTWDILTNVANVEVVAKMKSNSNTAIEFGVGVRAGGEADNEDGYLVRLRDTNTFELVKYVEGVLDDFEGAGTATFAFDANTWYKIRFRVEGTSLQAKVWEESKQEPDNWLIDITDGDLSSGQIGWHTHASSSVHFDFIAINIL